jgi:predicted nucleotidyltransferase
MTESDARVAEILRSLQERAKELNCLYRVEQITSSPESSLEDIFRGVIEAIPPGWQYPEICAARIRCADLTCASPTFLETPWMQSVPLVVQGETAGALEVIYTARRPQADEGPFLKEERKLLDSIADRVGSCITHRRLLEAMSDLQESARTQPRNTQEWLSIIDLLRRTDTSLLMRVARKMINHLCLSGVKEAEKLLHSFRAGRADLADVFFDSNRPSQLDAPIADLALADQVFNCAAAHLSQGEIVTCIHDWIKQDRASFLVNALENHYTSVSEISDAIQRYQHTTHGEIELAPSTRKGLIVSLVRRFLSDQLEYINVAKNHFEIKDFFHLIQRMIYPARGYGRTGGKGAGLLLAHQIVRRQGEAELAGIKAPKTWYVSSDVLHDFIYCNHLEDVFTQKYKSIAEIRREYPDIVQVFKSSDFSAEITKGLSLALDDLGERPIIVRSSSLLEDRFGAAFSGKYKSLFLANQGSKSERLNALIDAIGEVYASTFAPDPIQYRAERNLLDFQEGMGVLIQEVVGTRVGDYFLPAYAGVAFSHNEVRWSPRIRREDGLIRLVPGLGTRAVDRLGDDYPVLVSPGQPGLRASATPDEAVRYAPRYMDVINLRRNEFETVEMAPFLRQVGDQFPAVEQLLSIYQDGQLRQPLASGIDFQKDDVVVTFAGLLGGTPFVQQIRALLNVLGREMAHPVDIEFASDGRDLYLLQCRALTPGGLARPAPIPRDLPRARVVFSANRYISSGTVPGITHIVYIDAEAYARLATRDQLLAVGRAVGRLNQVLPKRQFILMGPGRWGSRGDVRLGVSVTYSDINNTAMLIEIARKKGDYTPDLSFGTHFFQDLVEASIRYLPLYPDDEGIIFNQKFLVRSPNLLAELTPEFAELAEVVHVIDVPQAADGQVLAVLMNADLEEAVGVLEAPARTKDSAAELGPAMEMKDSQEWRWRSRMAERIATQLDGRRFGVASLYLIGSVKNATAGPASDIDLLVHFTGTPEQQSELQRWLEGWSLALSEINYLRTGYPTRGLLDVHIITDEDIARKTSYAVKIGAITDPAQPLTLGNSSAE